MINLDPIAEQVGAGGATALGLVWMVLKLRPWKNGNGASRQEAIAAGVLIQKVEQLERIVSDVVPAITKMETSIAVLSTNVQNLTIEVARKVGQ